MQLVHVVERGERAQMSKRKGEFVTLDELIDDIGVDAARFFMLAALARHDARPRSRPGARAQPGEPGLLRPVRARAHREHPAQGRRASGSSARRAGRPRGGHARRSSPPSARWSSGCWSCPRRCVEAAERRAPHRLTDLRPRRRLRLPRVLPRLPRGRRRAGRARGLPAGPRRLDAPGDRAGARPGSGSRRRRACRGRVAAGLDLLAHRLRPAARPGSRPARSC